MFKNLLKTLFGRNDERKADNRVPFDIDGLEEKCLFSMRQLIATRK